MQPSTGQQASWSNAIAQKFLNLLCQSHSLDFFCTQAPQLKTLCTQTLWLKPNAEVCAPFFDQCPHRQVQAPHFGLRMMQPHKSEFPRPQIGWVQSISAQLWSFPRDHTRGRWKISGHTAAKSTATMARTKANSNKHKAQAPAVQQATPHTHSTHRINCS